MQEQLIIQAQLEFYRKGGSGCLFAAHAAVDPEKFGWRLAVSEVSQKQIETLIQLAINNEEVSTQSIIFPEACKWNKLKELLLILGKIHFIFLEQNEEYEGSVCLGYRLRVGNRTSWILGFGGFDFLPQTRQSLFTEIVFRCKPKPEYRQVMKESDPDILHIAHMDMRDMRENKFKSLWYGSINHTEEILGRASDLRSKAKTTFAIPVGLYQDL